VLAQNITQTYHSLQKRQMTRNQQSNRWAVNSHRKPFGTSCDCIVMY
jgi:hypothetical protein